MSQKLRCPGQDMQFWKPEDIFLETCPLCKKEIEFWKDEPQIVCPHCKKEVPNPKLDPGCAEWCEKAEECKGQRGGQGTSDK